MKTTLLHLLCAIILILPISGLQGQETIPVKDSFAKSEKPEIPDKTEKSPELKSEHSFRTEPSFPDSTAERETTFQKSIDIMAFEKRLLDKNETFLIRNNTPFHIKQLRFKLIYRTPQEAMIHYRDVLIKDEMLPNTTRIFDIDSFDKEKRYYYFKNRPTGKQSGYPFKVYFELQGYDIGVTPDNFTFISPASM